MYNSKGFTLLEILVAFLLLSVGVIGVLGLQSSVAHNLVTQNSNAVIMNSMNDMAARMQANIAGMKAGFYVTASPIQRAECLTASGCSSRAMAENDVYEWLDELSATAIPAGSIRICIDSNGTSFCDGYVKDGVTNYVIVVKWFEDQYSMTASLPVTVVN
jgi:type IV pilus assembly protein PilV